MQAVGPAQQLALQSSWLTYSHLCWGVAGAAIGGLTCYMALSSRQHLLSKTYSK